MQVRLLVEAGFALAMQYAIWRIYPSLYSPVSSLHTNVSRPNPLAKLGNFLQHCKRNKVDIFSQTR